MPLAGAVRLLKRWRQNEAMRKTKSLYHGHRFPAVVISCAVRWYFRFSLNLRDLPERRVQCPVSCR
jgi:transposase-like protein